MSAVASRRVRTPRRRNAEKRWLLTVLSARKSWSAISRLLSPITTIAKICFSRVVRIGLATRIARSWARPADPAPRQSRSPRARPDRGRRRCRRRLPRVLAAQRLGPASRTITTQRSPRSLVRARVEVRRVAHEHHSSRCALGRADRKPARSKVLQDFRPQASVLDPRLQPREAIVPPRSTQNPPAAVSSDDRTPSSDGVASPLDA